VVVTVEGSPHCTIEASHDGSTWHALNDRDSRATIQGDGLDWYFRARGYATLFHDYATVNTIGPVPVNPALHPTVTLAVERVVAWNRVFAVSLGGGALLAGSVVVAMRRRWVAAARRAAELQADADRGMPTRIGAYRIVEVLGAGGMATVYRGEDAEGHAVAIKVPHPGLLASAEARRRFDREMMVCVKLRHPRVVRIESFASPGDDPYFVMELVEGKPLADVDSPQPLDDTLALADEILEAIEYVHGQGIAHRDLKPGNIMMTSRGVKLMDFGLARPENASALTASGQVLGTPLYMAPEQVMGRPEFRSDLYAIGMIVYERLLGRSPLEGDVMTVLATRLSEDMPSLGSLRADLPPEVVAWVDRMVSTDVADRFDTAKAAREALRVLRS
jgi:serine/threonine protein kinase